MISTDRQTSMVTPNSARTLDRVADPSICVSHTFEGSGTVTKPVVVHGIRGYLGRTETFVGNQIVSLKQHRPIVLCHHESPNRAYDIEDMYVMERNERGARRGIGRFIYSWFKTLLPSTVEQAANWLRQYNPVLWHSHFGVDAAFLLPVFRKLNVPLVVSFYGYDVSSFPHEKGGIGKWYLSRIFKEADCLLAMSEEMKKDLLGLGAREETILVHYYGSNSKRFQVGGRRYAPKQEYNILCVGSLLIKKGQHHLLRALKRLNDSRPELDFRVTLVGDGPLEKELKAMVVDYKWHDRVDFAGHVPHEDPKLLDYYRHADVFVHFSTTGTKGHKEGIPGTIVEAMASGLPVVSTRHAGIPEVISSGQHGLLLEENDLDGLTKTIIRLLEDSELRSHLGKAAAKRALSELNLKIKTQELERIYSSVIEKSQRRYA
jgi:colanic acid/amylovoran biosynthesis glycosyltransferase